MRGREGGGVAEGLAQNDLPERIVQGKGGRYVVVELDGKLVGERIGEYLGSMVAGLVGNGIGGRAGGAVGGEVVIGGSPADPKRVGADGRANGFVDHVDLE